MRKNKVRETLREKIVATRGGKAGRPLERPRSEKEILERQRVFGIGLVTKANRILERGVDGGEPTQAEIECARQILDRYGHPRKTHQEVNVSNELEAFLFEIAPE